MNGLMNNLVAMNTERQYKIHVEGKRKSVEKLSSGYRINRSADDAAGLTISEKMRWQIRGLNRSSLNIQDGISFIQTAEGALNEIHSICQRVRELCVQAANDTCTDADRAAIQKEIDQLAEETGHITKNTEFNSQKIWAVDYVPYTSGSPLKFKVWQDSGGSYGGLNVADRRYTWSELGISGIYQNGEFQAGSYEISVPTGDYSTTNDSYTRHSIGTTFKIEVPEDSVRPNFKIYRGWSASASGITLDGITYGWDQLENEDHSKIFDTANIQAGQWGFSDYNNEHIWFDIPESAETLQDVIDGLNGDSLSHLNWYSQAISSSGYYAVSVRTNDRVAINSDNKDYVSGTYQVNADSSGVWLVANDTGNSLGKQTWSGMGLLDSDTNFDIKHSNTNHSVYSNEITVPHSHSVATTLATGYNAKGVTLSFAFAEEAARSEVVSGVDGQILSADIYCRTSGSKENSQNTSGKLTFSSASVSTNMSFAKAKEMGSDFENGNAFATGSIVEEDGNVNFEIRADNENTYAISGYSKDYLLDRIENALKSVNGSQYLTLNFNGVSDQVGSYSMRYQIDGITSAEKAQIRDDVRTANSTYTEEQITDEVNTRVAARIEDLKTKVYDDILASTMRIKESDSYMELNNQFYSGGSANNTRFKTTVEYDRLLKIQSGAKEGEVTEIEYRYLNKGIIGLNSVDVTSHMNASHGITLCDAAIDLISEERSKFGAYQNRLEYEMRVNDNTSENTQAAESKIRDTDMATEMVENSKHNILMQTGQSVLAQANQTPQGILQLIQ